MQFSFLRAATVIHSVRLRRKCLKGSAKILWQLHLLSSQSMCRATLL